MKYIIVDTWNGEGYSESSVKLVEGEFNQILFDESKKTLESIGVVNDLKFKVGGKSITYTVDKEDSGRVEIIKFKNQFGVEINPDDNSFQVFKTEKEYMDNLNEMLSKLIDEDELENLEDGEGCFHTDLGCQIFQKIVG